MKKRQVLIIPLLFMIALVYSFTQLNKTGEAGLDYDQVVVAFVTYNDHGNNLYIDNLTLGSRPSTVDLAITGVDSIPPGTYYTPGPSAMTIYPRFHITNIGSQASVDTQYAFLRITALSYFDSTEIGSISAGYDTVVQFDSIVVPPGTGLDMFAYLRVLGDTLRYNDSIYQYTLFQEGVQRNVLFQEFTSATSSGCAVNNVGMNNFINTNFSTITAIKYPWGIPSQNDSMYLSSKVQVDSLVNYFNASLVPLAYADGNTLIALPYNTDSLLNAPYQYRRAIGSPVSVSVTDSLSGNTVTSKIDMNIVSALPPGNYRLKVNAMQRVVQYDTIPTNWYDSTFYDVFRKALPGIHGVPITTSPGMQSFTYTYTVQPGWDASQMFTAVFIENEDTKEVLNSAKGGHFMPNPLQSVRRNFTGRDMIPFDAKIPYSVNGFTVTTGMPFNIKESPSVTDPQYKYFVQLFEGYYPTPGWTIINPDALFTWRRYTGANGPTFTGTHSMQMPFYDYDTTNAYRRDTLKSVIYYGLRDSNQMTFNYAYAPYSNTYRDSLKVLISVDGGLTYPFEVFNKGGNGLATAPATSTAFSPNNSGQWSTDTVQLEGIVSVEPISGSVPDGFTLSQNYPNPFNPATKITFSIPARTYASLKVYDIAGREIRSYVNAFIQAGVYSVDFDGSGLASGVYFYRLVTDEFVETKKMVLIK